MNKHEKTFNDIPYWIGAFALILLQKQLMPSEWFAHGKLVSIFFILLVITCTYLFADIKMREAEGKKLSKGKAAFGYIFYGGFIALLTIGFITHIDLAKAEATLVDECRCGNVVEDYSIYGLTIGEKTANLGATQSYTLTDCRFSEPQEKMEQIWSRFQEKDINVDLLRVNLQDLNGIWYAYQITEKGLTLIN